MHQLGWLLDFESMTFTTREDEDPCCKPLFWAYFGVSLALVVFTGVTSRLALGLLSFNQVDLEVIIKSGNPRARRNAAKIMPLVKKEHLLLCTLLMGKSLATEALPILMDTIFPVWIALLISVLLILAFGEILPQAVCARYGLSIGAKMSVLVRLLVFYFFPISYPMSKILDIFLRKEHSVLLRRAKLKTLVTLHSNEVGKGGELSRHETSIIAVKKIKFMSIFRQTMGLILSKGHSRIPVYSGEQKNIIGLILVKNLIFCHPEDETPIKFMTLRRMPRVYEDWPLYDIMNQFLKSHCHMAAVGKCKDVWNTEDNATGESGTLNTNGKSQPKQSARKGFVFPLAQEEHLSTSTETSASYRHHDTGGCYGSLEKILDETDAYVDVHNKLKIKPVYPRSSDVPRSRRAASFSNVISE
ncbi:hypothetical protein TIFTF001_013723 [Ficus carica]|uniref:CNNM transmembrane domain-containing protein n=1 Tax=Ficus carica TaxID=3494 RepID=A0AA88DIB4_FICCA|nr:hypothetical protein TIFTF001_013723 [Ficus carica]